MPLKLPYSSRSFKKKRSKKALENPTGPWSRSWMLIEKMSGTMFMETLSTSTMRSKSISSLMELQWEIGWKKGPSCCTSPKPSNHKPTNFPFWWKRFYHNQKVNKKKNFWIWFHLWDVAVVMSTKLQVTVISLNVNSNKEDAMPPFSIVEGLKASVVANIRVINTVLRAWLNRISGDHQ